MHTNSIQTEYYQQNDPIASNHNFQYFARQGSYKPDLSTKGGVPSIVIRLEQNMKIYQNQIRKNKQTINQLETQRKFFQKLSKKQKDKIDQIDIDKMRQDYQRRIMEIKTQTQELHQAIICFQSQQQKNQQSYKEANEKIGENKQFLMQTLIQIQKQNQRYADDVQRGQFELKELEDRMEENEKIIAQKEVFHRRYIELQIQIEKMQKKLSLAESPVKRQGKKY